ncbi:hypothetical protein, partial [Streptomyces sp. NPDC005476]|uniref:hypothetical protein n=1 Tax=Streptomyces sp. NPDC005476 TaxID=3156882 RepID=UPI0034571605
RLLARDRPERRVLINTIGPVWDAGLHRPVRHGRIPREEPCVPGYDRIRAVAMTGSGQGGPWCF